MKILITGGAGFIPSSLADKLASDVTNEIVLIDNLLTGSRSNVPTNENVTFIHGDVNNYTDMSSLFSRYGFDYVFHYAAVVGVKRTTDNPAMVLNDIQGIKNVLDLSKNTGVKRVFYSSSSEVYGEPVELPQHEVTTPLNSRLPYAIVKNLGEAYCKAYKKEYDLDYTIFRFFNTYGPKQNNDFVMSKFICAALKNEDITIYGEGNQTRTFCYIDDNISATLECLNKGLYINGVINLGSAKEITILDLAKTIIESTGSNSKIVHLPPLKEGDMTRRMPDNNKMVELLNRPLLQLKEGIKKLVEIKRAIHGDTFHLS